MHVVHKMSSLKALRSVVIYCIGIFWSLFVTLQVIRLIITKRGKFFYKKNRKVPPDVLQKQEFGNHQYAKLDEDIKLHYVISGPEDKPLMLMLHGFPEFWYSWRHQILEFNKDYRVVAVDLRGYGSSSKPTSVSAYSIDKLVCDVENLITHLGYEKCILLGHDWGGAISWILAAKSPHLLEKVIIMNCPQPAAMMKFVQKSWVQFMKSWYMFYVNLPYYPEWFFSTGDLKMLENAFQGRGMGAKKGAFTQEDMEAFKYIFNTKNDFTGPMNYIRASVRGLNTGRVPRTKIDSSTPVLLIWGTNDGALSKPMAELSRTFAEDFTLHYIEGASHWVQQDEPKLVNQYVRDFLA